MDTPRRIEVYRQQHPSPLMTHRQRRRMIKKAGRDARAIVIRNTGMGYPLNQQGYKQLIGFARDRPVSGAPYGA